MREMLDVFPCCYTELEYTSTQRELCSLKIIYKSTIVLDFDMFPVHCITFILHLYPKQCQIITFNHEDTNSLTWKAKVK